ncbi:MAG: 4Fe-4S binding protein [Eubacterium sp.]|nr:4Fe-4S binding protein [Eubacterium sp.]
MSKINKKKLMKNLPSYIRFAIQLCFFLVLPSAFTGAFSGVKYIFTSLGEGTVLEATSFVTVLITLCVFTVVFGRFFCGFACAFGSLGDWVYAIGQFVQKKLKKRLPAIPVRVRKALDWVKYVVLVLIAGLCFLGVYGDLSGSSPWDVFSMFTALSFHLDGYAVGIVLLALILVGMVFQERFFCRFICPMGAVFSLLPMLPLFSLFRSRENCIRGCNACGNKCPADLSLPDDGGEAVASRCFQCQKCTGICPKSNVHTGIKIIRGNEWWWMLVRGVILLACCKLLAGM